LDKLRVFLDTNVIISYLQGNAEVKDLFLDEILEKVHYVVSPVVYQELIFASNQMEKRDALRTQADFAKVDRYVEVVSLETSKIKVDSKNLRGLRNRLVHANDILILQTAVSSCDYLLTLDKKLLEIEKMDSMRIVSPTEYFHLVEVQR